MKAPQKTLSFSASPRLCFKLPLALLCSAAAFAADPTYTDVLNAFPYRNLGLISAGSFKGVDSGFDRC